MRSVTLDGILRGMAKRPAQKPAPSAKVPDPPPAHILNAQILGVSELCEFIGVERSTVHVWGYRKQLPPADYQSVNGFRAWNRATIIEWAAQTGRLTPWLKKEGAPYEPEGGYRRHRRTKAEMEAARAAEDAPARRAPRKAAAKRQAKVAAKRPAKKATARR